MVPFEDGLTQVIELPSTLFALIALPIGLAFIVASFVHFG
jgi:hypothetical protein